MKRSIFHSLILSSLFGSMLFASVSQAVTFEVRGTGQKPLLQDTIEIKDAIDLSVGQLSVQVLQKHRVAFEGDEHGLASIDGLGTSVKGNRYFGWCYSLNEIVPELMPDDAFIRADNDHVVWFYAYGELLASGEWRQCVPVVDLSVSDDLSSLRVAVELDDVRTVRKMIEQEHVATVNTLVPATGYPEGTPILTLAAREASTKVIRYLIQAGADLNLRTPHEETALMLASFFPDVLGGDNTQYSIHEGIVHDLVEAGADLESIPGHYTALGYAAYAGHTRILKYLLEKGANPDGDAADGKTSVLTPLIAAAMNGYKEDVRLLLRSGANPNVVNAKGHDALYLAKQRNQMHLVPYLICAVELQPGETFAEKCDK